MISFIRIFLFSFLLFISLYSFSAGSFWIAGGVGYSSPGDACAALFPSTPCTYAMGSSTSSGSFYSCLNQTTAYCIKTVTSCFNGYTSPTQPAIGPTYNCPSPRVIGGTCPNLTCTCPKGEDNGVCVNQCPSPKVKNPITGVCQNPCVAEPEPPISMVGVSISTGEASICTNGCEVHYIEYTGVNSSGFTLSEVVHYKTGQMCDVGDSLDSIPQPSPPSCPEPKVVRSDGTCGPPDPVCEAWQELKNHACVDKPCEFPKKLKCGTVNGKNVCSCTGVGECSLGKIMDAFGNCVVPDVCPEGQVMNSITKKCGLPSPSEPECPAGTHREGLICKPDVVPPPSKPPNSGPGDLDGDGTPNKDDDDTDGDGIPNPSDNDKDGDGIPNPSDSTPNGPGSSAIDTDGDGIPNDSDSTPGGPGSDPSDFDGDGVPDGSDSSPGGPGTSPGDFDGDGIPNGDDATPRGGPGGGGDGNCTGDNCGSGKPGVPVSLDGSELYKSKGKTFGDVWSSFTSQVQSAPIAHAASGFFSVSASGSCPVWEISIPYPLDKTYPITFQCSSSVQSALRLMGIVVLMFAAWLAFRIALL